MSIEYKEGWGRKERNGDSLPVHQGELEILSRKLCFGDWGAAPWQRPAEHVEFLVAESVS